MQKNRFLIIVLCVSLAFGLVACTDEKVTESQTIEATSEPVQTPKPTPDPRIEEYSKALELMYLRKFDEAKAAFESLGEYSDSKTMASKCQEYKDTELEKIDHPYISEWAVAQKYDGGTMYYCAYGLFYVPNEVNAKTTFMLYHSGGGGEEDYLYYHGLYPYFETYSPNAVMFFCNNSGYNVLKGKTELCYKMLNQIAQELGIVVHDLALVGSSQGCFTALKAAYLLYKNHNFKVNCVVTLDTGMEWIDPANLTDEECDIIAEAGTVFYLFEQEDTGMNVEEIKRFVDHGIETYIVACKEKQHNTISVNAYKYGVFDWAAGEDIELPPWQYVFIKLEPGMKDNGKVVWKEDPNATPTPTAY